MELVIVYLAVAIAKAMLSLYSAPYATHVVASIVSKKLWSWRYFTFIIVAVPVIALFAWPYLLWKEKTKFFWVYDNESLRHDIENSLADVGGEAD